jgi:hypothetical protein
VLQIGHEAHEATVVARAHHVQSSAGGGSSWRGD